MNNALKEVKSIIDVIQDQKLYNELEALNFLDELNKLSVSF